MEEAQYLVQEIKNLLRCLVYRKFDYAVDDVLRILQEQYGERFYRVTDWPDEAENFRSNFVIINSPDDVKVSIVGDGRVAKIIRGYLDG